MIRFRIPLALALSCSVLLSPLQAERPNFVFILADDYGIMDVGIEGSEFYETPNLDRLAKGGMRFTQGYATCQVCSPSRVSIMTGKIPCPPRGDRLDRRCVGEEVEPQRQGLACRVPARVACRGYDIG